MRRKFSTTTIALALACLGIATLIAARTLPISTVTDGTNASAQASQPAAQAPQGLASASAAQRNPAQYRSGGSFNLPDNISPAVRKQIMMRIRAFLWQQWQTKERGRIAYISTILQGYAPGTTTLYVEPDAEDRWRIALEVQGQSAPQYFYEVEEITVDADGLPLEGQEPNDSTSVSLHFKPSPGSDTGMIF